VMCQDKIENVQSRRWRDAFGEKRVPEAQGIQFGVGIGIGIVSHLFIAEILIGSFVASVHKLFQRSWKIPGNFCKNEESTPVARDCAG